MTLPTLPPMPRILPFLNLLKYVVLAVGLLLFINFNIRLGQQAADTKEIAVGTNKIVKSQGDILDAIKQVTEDTRITAAEQTSIIICMLQVPIEERTTNLQAECREQATNPVANAGNTSQTSGSGSGSVESSSSPQSAPNNQPRQQDNTQSGSDSDAEEPEPSTIERILKPVTDFLGGIL